MSIPKQNAAYAALEFVEDGMTLGLGSGSTAEIFMELLGEKVAGGLKIQGVPTSQATARCAEENGIPLIEPNHVAKLDLCIDGADEVDPMFNMIKGGGACLLREKIIASNSAKIVCIVDDRKIVETLGAFALPVEVDPFAMGLTANQIFAALKATGVEAPTQTVRENDGKPLITDGGHHIIDCACEAIPDPVATAQALSAIAGVMEHGLFIDIADIIIVGEADHARVMELSRE
jgi:ribose 5-phosphate isomerase A